MKYQNFIRGLIISTLIFAIIILFLTFAASPEKPVNVVLYFASLFFFILGVASIFGFYFRKWWNHNELLFENVKLSLRQSSLFALFILSLLALSALRLLTWWDGLILGISFILIELYFKTRS